MILIDPQAGLQFALRLTPDEVQHLRDALLEAHSSHKGKGEQEIARQIERLYEVLHQQYQRCAALIEASLENTP